MKRIILSLSMVLVAAAMIAQQAVITFEKTEHDFGKINEADGKVTIIFNFTNEGMAPLVLSNVRASCGCTTPQWTKEPIEPGQSGKITVTYNPNGRPGRFQKTITVTSNCAEPTNKLYIKGEVIPKPAKPVDNYPVKMGELSLKSQTANLGTLKKGETGSKVIEYANLTNQAIQLSLQSNVPYLTAQLSNTDLQPNQKGQITITFASGECKAYGPINEKVYVLVNSKKDEANYIAVSTDIIENFSSMTTEQRQQAPILEVAQQVNLGSVKAGKKASFTFPIRNSGPSQALIIRALSSDNNNNVIFTSTKSIKKGQKGNIKATINTISNGTTLKAGSYSCKLTLYTNDPNKPKTVVTINWTVAE